MLILAKVDHIASYFAKGGGEMLKNRYFFGFQKCQVIFTNTRTQNETKTQVATSASECAHYKSQSVECVNTLTYKVYLIMCLCALLIRINQSCTKEDRTQSKNKQKLAQIQSTTRHTQTSILSPSF